jgi:hypothetical protein
VTVPETVLHLRTAYSQYRDRFEVVGIADPDHDDLTEVFRGSCETLYLESAYAYT